MKGHQSRYGHGPPGAQCDVTDSQEEEGKERLWAGQQEDLPTYPAATGRAARRANAGPTMTNRLLRGALMDSPIFQSGESANGESVLSHVCSK